MVKGLAQQTYLPHTKILVCDDGSTDGSFEELRRCAELYCVPMEVFFNDKNFGLAQTIKRLYRMIQTPFWAVLDPDDYYISPYRLERAVKFLDAHPNCAMHACNFYYETRATGKIQPRYPENFDNFLVSSSEGDICLSFLQTSCATFRNFWNDKLISMFESVVDNRRTCWADSDAFRNFVAINYGDLYFDNFFGSVYQQDGSAVFGSLSQIEQVLACLDAFLNIFKMERNFFKNYQVSLVSLKLSINNYVAVWNLLTQFMQYLKAHEIKATKQTVQALQLTGNDVVAVIRYLMKCHDEFLDYGVQIN